MQKFQISLDRSFSASTKPRINSVSATAEPTATVQPESPLFKTQQNLSFEKEYFLYLQQNGVSIVNDLNVKNYLNKSSNETLANEFVTYLSGLCTHEEFVEILYDNKKLSDFFNDYYQKFSSYSNQGDSDNSNNESISLIETKSRINNQDKLYTKTNSLTNYLYHEVDFSGNQRRNIPEQISLSFETFYFSGKDESYYINIKIGKGNKTFFSDDFSEYYQNVCEGTITYNKYTYMNSVTSNVEFLNYSALQEKNRQFNLSLGPEKGSVSYLRSLLPLNFLSEYTADLGGPAGDPSISQDLIDSSTIAQITQLAGEYGYVIRPPDLINSETNSSPLFFTNFNSFAQKYNFSFFPWNPQFSDPRQYREKYIYQQVISTVNDYNAAIYVTAGRGDGEGAKKLVYSHFEEVPNPYDSTYQGQLWDSLNRNTYRIRIIHSDYQQARALPEKIMVQWEPASIGSIGADDGLNVMCFNEFGNPNPNLRSIILDFGENVPFLDFEISLYKNLQSRQPIVLSLRKINESNFIIGYVIIYLEEFYQFQNYSSNESVDVISTEICNLYYNSFVGRNFNDNFLEYQRPDSMRVNFINTTGLTLQQQFDFGNISEINSRLLSAFNDYRIDLASISAVAGVSESGVYNIYVWGSYLFGTNDEYSDIDLIIVADGQIPVRQVKNQGIDIAIYTPQRFQYELDQIVVKMFGDSVSSDRVFSVYNSSEQGFKILERIKFQPNLSKALIKTKATEFKDERWRAVEQAFFRGDIELWQKRLWSIFRNLVFSTQVLKNGQITDLGEPRQYLVEIQSKSFAKYDDLVSYFNPKIENLYSTLLSL